MGTTKTKAHQIAVQPAAQRDKSPCEVEYAHATQTLAALALLNIAIAAVLLVRLFVWSVRQLTGKEVNR